MDRIDGLVVEVEAEDFHAARAALQRQDWIKNVTQLGSRIHILLRKQEDDPAGMVSRVLAQEGVKAEARTEPPNLEDVFVAVTHGGRNGRDAPVMTGKA